MALKFAISPHGDRPFIFLEVQGESSPIRVMTVKRIPTTKPLTLLVPSERVIVF